MARKRTQAKPTETDATESPSAAQVMTCHRKTPPWHRQYLRRLAIHGDKERAAKECKVSIRHIYRTARAKPRFSRGMKAAERIAIQAHTDRMQRALLDVAENGALMPIVSGGKVVTHCRKLIPSLMKMVAEVTVPMFREPREARERLKQPQHEHHEHSVSNTLNVSLLNAHADNPTVRALLLALSDELTRSKLESPIIDVTPVGEPPAAPAETPPIVVRSDDD